jgi:hypothetical protein
MVQTSTSTLQSGAAAQRRALPRVLVRIRPAWRGMCELFAFVRAVATALVDLLRGRLI